MNRTLGVAMVQHSAESLSEFEKNLRAGVKAHPNMHLWVYPELHFDSLEPRQPLDEIARPLQAGIFQRLGKIAAELQIWLVPGSFAELGEDGKTYNTAVVFNPQGEMVTSYRKIFPWRPSEISAPGSEFRMFEIPGFGRVGLSICYDIWFPEHSRNLAWLGADLILNLVQTATTDREQEQAIVRGNAIMNQVWIASLNGAAPTARGRSLLVDPDGVIRAASRTAEREILTTLVDFGQVDAVREHGTAAVSRPWAQFRADDAPIYLPLYDGRISPVTWEPKREEA